MKNLNIRISKEDKSGIYLTVIIHLAGLVVMLVFQISTYVRGEHSYLLDFSNLEQEERLKQETEFKESISDRLDEMIAAAPRSRTAADGSENIRNIAVDAGSALKDDRNTDVEQLYRDAARLDRELKSGAFAEPADDDESYAEIPSGKTAEKDKAEYSGPSVVSYSLDGRKALTLSIPAYRCLGGGDVTILVTVSQNGDVVNAKVVEEVSSQDQCLRNYAIRAARLSKFTASGTAPKRQMGEIVYRFIAQ